MVIGKSGKKNPTHSIVSITALSGVSVRVTTQAKKIANALLIATRTKARKNVFPMAIGNRVSVKAAIQPWIVQIVGCPGRLATKLFTNNNPTG
jgi:hypothetical protein